MSIVKANKFQTAAGQTYQGVLQVVHVTLTSAPSFVLSNAWADTGLSATITPYFSTSKLFIVANAYASSLGSVGLAITNSANTSLVLPDNTAGQTRAMGGHGHRGNDSGFPAYNSSMYGLTNAGSTTAQTYKLRIFGADGATIYLNRSADSRRDQYWLVDTVSTLTIMEIAQ